MFALTLTLTAGYVFFSLKNGQGHFDWSSLAFAGFPLIGAVILYRQPRNPVGWIVAIFGLFNILRFYRSKYDSQQIIERFTSGLRSEVDLDAINQHFLEAVDESLQPNFSTLWLIVGQKGK